MPEMRVGDWTLADQSQDLMVIMENGVYQGMLGVNAKELRREILNHNGIRVYSEIWSCKGVNEVRDLRKGAVLELKSEKGEGSCKLDLIRDSEEAHYSFDGFHVLELEDSFYNLFQLKILNFDGVQKWRRGFKLGPVDASCESEAVEAIDYLCAGIPSEVPGLIPALDGSNRLIGYRDGPIQIKDATRLRLSRNSPKDRIELFLPADQIVSYKKTRFGEKPQKLSSDSWVEMSCSASGCTITAP